MISLSLPHVTVIDDGANMIRVALTPVFLLTGIGTLINIFSTRLALVATQVDEIAESVTKASATEKVIISHRLDRLRQRSLALDVAVIFGSIGGTATCVAVLTLFYGALRNGMVASMLYASFALAMLCTIGALCAFTFEVVMSSRLLRLSITHNERDAEI